MKSLFKFPLYAVLAAGVAFGAASCSDDNDLSWSEERENALKGATTAFADKTVIPIYHNLADATIELTDLCAQIETSVKANASTDISAAGTGSFCAATQDLLQKACDKWYEARKYWELSEAFLFGAAGDYNIDPHIDSWPLNATDLQALLDDPYRMGMMDDEYAAGLGYGLQGFHAVEYMIFDRTKSSSELKGYARTMPYKQTAEVVYLAAVAGDMANQCVRLEAAWAGLDNVSEEKQTMLADAELEPAFDYGESMRNAGKGGSAYVSYLDAAQDILQGCSDIADEVGNTKIGRPNTGTSGEDISYIESPYAKNSKTDFYDNIVSIKNAYQGTNSGDASVSDYLASVNEAADKAINDALDATLTAIDGAPAPFVNYAGKNNANWAAATTACNALKKALDNASTAIGQ